MASWLFGSGHTATKPTYFDIRLENDTLKLPRDDENTSYGHLNGTVVVCLNSPFYMKDIKLYLRGKRYAKIDPTKLAGQNAIPASREVIFYRQVWNFLPESHRTALQPGNYEFPFSISLHNTMPESVDGMEDCYIRYEVTAAINCPSGVIQESRTLKVLRTPDYLSFFEPLSIERPWPNKLMYETRIPGRSFNIGDPIQVDFRYIPLRKGVYPTLIQLKLVETHTLKPTVWGGRSLQQTRSKTRVDDGSTYEESSGVAITNEDLEEWRVISHTLPPARTGSCLPSCETSIVTVQHSLEAEITLQNPEGHISRIDTSFPISMCLPSGTKPAGIYSHCINAFAANPPPCYAEYLRDEPYCPDFGDNPRDAVSRPPADPGVDNYAYLNDLLMAPCYDTAISSVAPKTNESPPYWGIASAPGQ